MPADKPVGSNELPEIPVPVHVPPVGLPTSAKAGLFKQTAASVPASGTGFGVTVIIVVADLEQFVVLLVKV